MYQDQVFCFTPKGSLISLPRGATPIDLPMPCIPTWATARSAPRSTAITCPLHTPLNNGDQVEIITMRDSSPRDVGAVRGDGPRPGRDPPFLRHAQRDEHVRFGRKILEKTFADEGAS
jgi:GTP pyrophosphokinase